MSFARPRLALTLGDCAGIGPELVLRALVSSDLSAACRLCVYGNRTILERVSKSSSIAFPSDLLVMRPDAFADAPRDRHVLLDFPFDDADTLIRGTVQAVCGVMAHTWIRAAVRDIRAGLADALVTAPINKEALHLAGVNFPGHTEILSSLTATPDPCMAFYSPGLIVSLATIHEALSDVPRLLNANAITRTLRLTHDACRGFGIAAPRIGVLALNPHAGEHGLFGKEEAEKIVPAINRARAEGIDATGPLVPDAAFTWLAKAPAKPPFDAYVAMYHDQGLIPFKMVAFDTGVNVTLGLPIIRTSPDHGTAFDLAWQGKASPASLFSAIALAAGMARANVERRQA
jgi:4-hydroxythreonine-4-phosphate dehydrogenase